jgi:hypothetical protein
MKAQTVQYPEGLFHALLALASFRHRNDRYARFKNPKTRTNINQTISRRKDHVTRSRKHIVQARQAGFQGSIYQAVIQFNATRKEE